ncbi:hypothetical protein BDZ91DRAFT_739420 [Kalaharituber pfeilii]|nr:hypothetical protein BDZ91DRAFT_739420 [Kalaharituber pfeilii]
MEGYPVGSIGDFKDRNANDLVLYIIGAVLYHFNRKMGCQLRLKREKGIIAMDCKMERNQEFVLLDLISAEGYEKDRYALVGE